jgi:hypothetical protein
VLEALFESFVAGHDFSSLARFFIGRTGRE